MIKREVILYKTVNGASPINTWISSIKDPVIRFRISSRIDRIKTGNLGEWKYLKDYKEQMNEK